MFRCLTSRRSALAAGGVVMLILVGSVLAGAQALSPNDPPVLDGIGNIYLNAARGWQARLVPIAQRTFMMLAALEFAVSGLVWMVKRESLDELAAKFLLKFTLIAFLLTLITSFNQWMPPIVNGFVSAGAQVSGSGSTTMSPSAVLDVGRVTAMTVLRTLTGTVWWRDPAMGFMAVGSAIVIALSYTWVATQVLLVMIESYIVIIGGGVLFLGFAASRWTAAYAEHLVAHAFYLGARAFFLYLIVGIGLSVGQSLVPLIQVSDFDGSASYIFQVTGAALMFAVVSTVIPMNVAWKLMGKSSLGLARVYERLA